MKKMKDYLRKVTAGLLLVAMSSGSVGVNTVSAATDDDNDGYYSGSSGTWYIINPD